MAESIAQAVSVNLDGLYCLDPGVLYRSAVGQGLPTDHWWGKPNRFFLPRGKDSGRGWILLQKSDADALSLSSTHNLNFSCGTESVTLNGLYILSVQVLYADKNAPSATAPCLVELVDKRYLHRQCSIYEFYNVRRAAPVALSGAKLYFDHTLNSSALWTWQEMLDDIWTFIPSFDNSPTLPRSPDGTPSNFRFLGNNAWEVYCEILHNLCMEVVYNPLLTDNAFSIVDLAVAQTMPAAFTSSGLLQDTNATKEGTCRYPDTIRVCFPRLDKHYGIEQETPDDIDNWLMSSMHYIDTPSGISDAAGGTFVVWNDLEFIANFDGTKSNDEELETRAAEVSDKWGSYFVNQLSGYKRFLGAHYSILPGSIIYSVQWYDCGDSLGMETEYHGYYYQPSDSFLQKSDSSITKSFQPPNLAERTYPIYPKNVQLVKASSGTKNEYGLYPGKVLRLDPVSDLTGDAGYVEVEDCWLRGLDSSLSLSTDDRFMGRLNGSAAGAAGQTEVRPLYLVGGTSALTPFELSAALSPGGSALAYRLDPITYDRIPDNGGWEMITVWDSPAMRRGRAATEVLTGSVGFAQMVGAKYEIVVMQPMALMILAQAYANWQGSEYPVYLKTQTIMQPIGGVLNALPSQADNIFGTAISTNDWLVVVWNENMQTWGCFRAGGEAQDRRCNGTISGTLQSTTASQSVVITNAIIGSDSGTVTAYNVMGLAGQNGTACKIEYNNSNSQWEFYMVKPEQQSLQVDYRYDTASHKFQKKTRTAGAWFDSAVTDWVDVYAAVDLGQLVINVISGGTALQEYTLGAGVTYTYALEKGAVDGPTNIIGIEDCP